MSVENGERFIRMLKDNADLRKKVRAAGDTGFIELSTAAGASCTTFEVVSAMVRQLESGG